MKALYGLIGEKLTHSVSPAIHEKLFKILGMEASYELFQIPKEKLKEEFENLKARGAKGLNVTIPYKVDIMEYIDHVAEEAEKIGAVNTICFKEGKTTGYNTDYYGFGRMLEKNHIVVTGEKAVVLGAGGAAKAVLQYVIDKNASEVILVSRDKAKAKNNFKDVNIIDYEELKALKSGEVIINCTPCGMYPKIDAIPVDSSCISKFSAAVDLIYNPLETVFLKYAKESGLKAVNGLYMLVGQAIAAEELWNNISISEEITDKIYEELI